MSDLIYRDELKKTIKALVKGEVQQLLRIIDGQPRVDAKIEQHGHWVWMGESGCKCSLCKKRIRIRERRTFEYCPKCGAKMDEEENS